MGSCGRFISLLQRCEPYNRMRQQENDELNQNGPLTTTLRGTLESFALIRITNGKRDDVLGTA